QVGRQEGEPGDPGRQRSARFEEVLRGLHVLAKYEADAKDEGEVDDDDRPVHRLEADPESVHEPRHYNGSSPSRQWLLDWPGALELLQRLAGVDRQPLQVGDRIAAAGEAETERPGVAGDRDVEAVAVERDRQGVERLEPGALEVE